MSAELIKTSNIRADELKREYDTMLNWWVELSQYHLGYRGRFLTNGKDRGKIKRFSKIYNNKSRLAARTMQGGFQAGITSPSRPWFRLKTQNKALMDAMAVSYWLDEVEKLMRAVFAQSNTYNSLLSMYLELGVFGTAAVGVYKDFEDVIRLETFTIGQYKLGRNAKGVIDTFVHDYELSINELVKEFGIDAVSKNVRVAWKNGKTDTLIEVRHIVEPNDNRNSISPLAKHKRFRSLYYELNSKKDFLRESGFDEFPYLTPRSEVVGQDTYATSCSGMDALHDAKLLQDDEFKLARSTEHSSDPAYQINSSLAMKIPDGSLHAGTQVVVDNITDGARPIFDGNHFRTDGIEKSIIRREDRISKAFFENLFMMLINSERTQITATEINAKNSEKVMAVGSVLERLNKEALSPLITRTFNIMSEAGILPEPPEELEDADISIEFTGVLAQAQQLTTLSEIDQTAAFVLNMAGAYPEARHKFNINEAIDSYGEAIGIESKIIRSNDEVDAILAQEQEVAERAQRMEEMAALSDSAKNLADIETSGGNAASEILEGTLGG